MFTGIVEQMGTLAEVKPMAGGYRLRDRDRAGVVSCARATVWPSPASA